jgi:lipoyl(octanoyl) transferase
LDFFRDIPWSELENRQTARIESVRRDPNRGFLLFSEPQPTFTAGLSAAAADLLWTEPTRERERTEVHAVSRAGKWTFHGPGQLLLYPIVFLPSLGLNKRAAGAFLENLRGSVVHLLRGYGIDAQAPPHSSLTPFGVYARGRKLASFGISLRGGICAHGLALYLSEQHRYFAGIHPCGVPAAPVTSVQEQGVDLGWDRASRELAELVKKGFQENRT